MSQKSAFSFMEAIGLILIGFFAFLDITFILKLFGIIIGVVLAKHAIYKSLTNECKSMDFQKLRSGMEYTFLATPVQIINCSVYEKCTQYYAQLEQNGRMIPVEINIVSKIEIEGVMGPLNRIERGNRFKIQAGKIIKIE